MKPICVPCERFMRMKKSGFYFTEGKPYGDPEHPWDGNQGKDSTGWTPYKVWVGDLYECPDCHAQVVSGVGRNRLAEHHEEDFDDVRRRTNADQFMLRDCA